MQRPVTGLTDFPPRRRIGIRGRGLILRPDGGGPLVWSWARWSLIPPGAKEPPAYPLNNARSDKLTGWPWKAVARQRCLIVQRQSSWPLTTTILAGGRSAGKA